jgi:hypothetical protein
MLYGPSVSPRQWRMSLFFSRLIEDGFKGSNPLLSKINS